MHRRMGESDDHRTQLRMALMLAPGLALFAVGMAALCVYSVQADARLASLFQITAHEPALHEVGVALTSTIHATFDDDVNSSTVTSGTFAVHGHLGGLATGTFTYDGGTRTITLDPDRAFHAGEVLRVHATSAISSSGGTPLSPYGWQFTAGDVFSRCVPDFSDIDAGLVNVLRSAVAWGDYDGDGDLDVLVTGYGTSRIYRNDGGGSFTDIVAGLRGVTFGSAGWGDYDNDGDLDILLTGYGRSHVSKVYRNDGGGAFTDISAGLTGVSHGSAAWGDYDNDGDLDILLTGHSGHGRVSELYRNDGDGAFTSVAAGIGGVANSSVAWGDYDNDGDLDILLTGRDNTRTEVSKVYRNDSNTASPGFIDVAANLVGVAGGSVAWGDYDNDGDLDILLTGGSRKRRFSIVYRNDAGTFADIGAGLADVQGSAVAWGDADNDGDLDILLTGNPGGMGPCLSLVYLNDSGTFTLLDAHLTGVALGSVAWGDYDNDGDLDILLTGSEDPLHLYGPVSKVYRNDERCVIVLPVVLKNAAQ